MTTATRSDLADLKRRLPVEEYFRQHGSTQDAHGRWRCLCAASHTNGDADHSVTITRDSAKCWSQGCFSDKGSDIFAVIGVVESVSGFKNQKRRVMELVGTSHTVRHAYRWEDAEGYVAYKIRWDTEGKDKCAWALDPEARQLGQGACDPTVRHLSRVNLATRIINGEGERDQETIDDWLAELEILDIVATTPPNGAGDVKAKFLQPLYGKAQVYLSGDNDTAGRGYVQKCGVLLHGHVADLRHLVVPDGFKDWTEWKESGATAQDFRQQLDTAIPWAEPQVDIPIGKFAPIPAPQLLDESEPVQAEWVWEEFLPQGGLAALVAKPKVGKTTNAYELAIKVAQGLPYLGRATRQGRVLILALEEHRREVKRRLRNLGADQIEEIHLHVGPLADSPDTFHHLTQYIEQHGITLVILDTLNSFWSVQEENDAVAVTQAIKPILHLARTSGAAILLLHHARKSDGEFGDEIRGSGALFSLLDVAIILKRHEVENQRKLTAISRYPETPPELIIELREHGHEALGDPASVGKSAKVAKVQSALTDTPEPAPKIGKRAGVSRGAAYTILDGLVTYGQAQRTGTGKRNDPYLYGRTRIVFPLETGGANETNHSPDTLDPEPSPNGGLVSFGGRFPRGNTIRNANKTDRLVSFRGDGGQTIRNETERDDPPEELFTEEVVDDDN